MNKLTSCTTAVQANTRTYIEVPKMTITRKLKGMERRL